MNQISPSATTANFVCGYVALLLRYCCLPFSGIPIASVQEFSMDIFEVGNVLVDCCLSINGNKSHTKNIKYLPNEIGFAQN